MQKYLKLQYLFKTYGIVNVEVVKEVDFANGGRGLINEVPYLDVILLFFNQQQKNVEKNNCVLIIYHSVFPNCVPFC